MPQTQKHRLDELPLDRRIAGEARGLGRDVEIGAIYERRELEPTASHPKRRTGTLRVTNSQPKLLGATRDSTKGAIRVDHDFTTATSSDWSVFGTVYMPTTSDTTTRYFKVLSFGSIRLYVKKTFDTAHKIQFIAVDDGDVTQASATIFEIDTASGNTFHFFLCRDTAAGQLRLNSWYMDTTPGADTTGSPTFAAEAQLEFLGTAAASYTPLYADCVLNNVIVYDNDDFSTGEYDDIATDTTPDTSGLLWHDIFSEGGNILVHDDSSPDIYTFITPTQPQTYGTDPTSIRFGGRGTAEIPFYLDFDEYFWTATNAAARLEWCFQLKITLPNILSTSTVFELQDLIRLEVVDDSGTWKLQGTFNDGGTVVLNSTGLAAGTAYDVFVARDGDSCYLKVGTTEASAGASNPIIYAYDKTLGFVVGDKVDFENSAPFGGQLERFALHNSSDRTFGTREDAVFYYDVDSVQGDELLDRGNRSLNGYLGVRSDTQPPYYKQGGFPGGAYVAASGGYLISNARPDIDYTGQLKKPLTKDAVVQRRGQRAFLTSNGVSYIVDDKTKSFRPLGVPRPSTKVSCTPQGIGPIDGFVRYAYRYVTIDGTVGPVFELDPCDATGGVNVYLGAETFSTPTDPAFGLSYGECEGDKQAADDEVEVFIARDIDASDGTSQLLHKDISYPGLTLETAFRYPDAGDGPKESVISQGVYPPVGPSGWMCRNAPKEFPWIGQQNRECSFQFTFRFKGTGQNYEQCLFMIGAENQKYTTGWISSSTHWRLHHLVVSIQRPFGAGSDLRSIVVTRDQPAGSKHRDNELHHWAHDVTMKDSHDYSIFVSRSGSYHGAPPGADLTISLYNHTEDTWEVWAGQPAGTVYVRQTNFWGAAYSGSARDKVVWGACRWESNSLWGKTRVRSAIGSDVFNFDYLGPFANGATTANPTGGARMYHGRMWSRDHPQQVFHYKGLDRYGARNGPLKEGLQIDLAFCSDSSKDQLSGGWDHKSELRAKFKGPSAITCKTILTDDIDQSVFLAYGYDTTMTGRNPVTHATTSTDQIPLWCAYSTRDEGSLVIGTGQFPSLTIANKKWHDGSSVKLFSEFANVIDIKQWTWITLYFHQLQSVEDADRFDVFLERLFIDGNTGDWGDLFDGDVTMNGPQGKAQNTAAGDGQYALFTVGGVPGIDNSFEVETAETRLFDGQYYTAEGVDGGKNEFGPYLSTRIPPNSWDELWHYLRFAPLDVNDMENQAWMNSVGTFADASGASQQSANNVKIFQTAEVKEGGDDSGSGGSTYFIPFPTPPLSSIRGIQIFRSQIVPVSDKYPNGEPNPNAQLDAFKACRAAPLYYLSEIPDGTQAYFDSAIDTLLGAELNLTEGLIPGNPGGVFEWDNYLAIWVTDIPRIHFAASPDSWESFPSDMVLDLPLKEYGTIEAATELASRDARNSRVLVLGKSWGLFLDGSPLQPRTNTLGGGVGAASSRCLVVEKGVAYAYNGTLWAITGDGQVEDIGMPVLDLLPPPERARLSVSSSLGSLYVINESTGLTLRWHFARREWFVEDRSALSTTDIAGIDNWVHVSGWPSKGNTAVYADDVEDDTPTSVSVTGVNNADDYVLVDATTGLKVGQRVTVAADEDPRIRQTLTIDRFQGTRIYFTEDLDLPSDSSNTLSGETVTLTYTLYPGVGYWGTMLDTGQFRNTGVLHHVDMGVTDGDGWHAMSAGADFAGDPSDRSSFDAPESNPTPVVYAGSGSSARWGLTERQRIQRLLVWTYEPEAVGLSELELSYSPNE